MGTEYVLLVLVGALLIHIISATKNGKGKTYNFPNGPTGIPVLGNILQMAKNPHLKFSQWAYQYGPLYRIHLGPKPAIVISDATAMKEVLSLQPATGKFLMETMVPMSRGPYGILHTTGTAWTEQRQFCLRILVQSGFGNKSLEPKILAESEHLVESINKQNSENGVEIYGLVRCTLTNILMRIIMDNERLGLTEEFEKVEEEFVEAIQYTIKTGLGFFPWLKYIAPGLSGYRALDKASLKIHEYWIGHITQHKQGYIPYSPRDLVDAYFDKMKTQDRNSGFYGQFGWKNVVASIVELFLAATETTTASLIWFLYHVAFRLYIQLKIQQEFDDVMGDSDTSLEIKGKLPYTEAVMLEVMRFRPPVSMGLFHELLDDIKYSEYSLPKGTILIANIWHCHHDEKVWGDPEVFRPERFLATGGDKLKDKMVTFQPGKRSCLGEPLAKDIMFLNVTKILKEFEIKPVNEISKETYFEPNLGMRYLPKPRKLIMQHRI